MSQEDVEFVPFSSNLDQQYRRIGLENERDGFTPSVIRVDTSKTSNTCATVRADYEDLKVEQDQPLPAKRRPWTWLLKAEILAADYWTFEVLGMIICLGSLLAVAAVLYAFDNRPIPHTSSGLTLNTIISVLATLSRSAAVLVASGIIAQQKWLRFETRSRAIIELSLYDDASRGPWGSLCLLWTLRAGYISALAAIVGVLAFAFEPFIQQSIIISLKEQLVSVAARPMLPTVRSMTFQSQSLPDLEVSLRSSVTQALYADKIEPLQPVCPFARCDWPSYQSAAFCSLCEDALADLNIQPLDDEPLRYHIALDYLGELTMLDLDLGSGNSINNIKGSWSTLYNISLGQGQRLAFNSSATSMVDFPASDGVSQLIYPETIVWNLLGGGSEFIVDNEDLLQWSNVTINGVVGPLYAFGYLNLSIPRDGHHLTASSAKRCILSFCAQQYSTQYHNGSLNTRVNNSTWGALDYALNWTATLGDTNFQGGFDLTTDYEILEYISTPLYGLFGNITTQNSVGINLGNPNPLPTPGADFVRFISDVEGACQRIAQGLTNVFQKYGDGQALGDVYIDKSFVQVRWAWLVFPIFLALVVLAILVATMIQTRRQHLPVWKSSPFPLLFNMDSSMNPNRVKNEEGEEVEAGENGLVDATAVKPPSFLTSSHQEIAKHRKLRLRKNRNSWAFQNDP